MHITLIAFGKPHQPLQHPRPLRMLKGLHALLDWVTGLDERLNVNAIGGEQTQDLNIIA